MRFTVEWTMSGGSFMMGTVAFEQFRNARAVWRALKREGACTQAIIKRDGVEIRVWRL